MAKPRHPGLYPAPTIKKRLEMNTLLMIKPDIVANGQYGEILAFVLKNRFEVTNLRMVRINTERAEQFYAAHKGKEFFYIVVPSALMLRIIV